LDWRVFIAVAGLTFTNYWSFNVTRDYVIREKTHEFSLTFICNYRSAFNRFRDNAVYWQKIEVLMPNLYLTALLGVLDTVRIS